MARKSSFARSFFNGEAKAGEEAQAQLDESVPVPRSRPMGRMASRRHLGRPSMTLSAATAAAVSSAASASANPTSAVAASAASAGPSQRGVEATKSGDSILSLSSAAASLASVGPGGSGGRGSNSSQPPLAVAAAPPRNAEENYLRQSIMRQSGASAGFDMTAISAAVDAAVKEEDALESGFDDEEVLEQYRIMAQHEATLRVKANTGFDMEDYEKRRKVQGNETKDKKELYGGGKKPKLGLPPPQPVLNVTMASNAASGGGGSSSSSNIIHGGLSTPPTLPLGGMQTHSNNGSCSRGSSQRATGGSCSGNYQQFLQDQRQKADKLPEMSKGEVVRNTETTDGEHVVRCWGCRVNLRVNYIATLVQCPECGTVSQARKRS